jgi:hypothetical protein
MSFSQSPCPFLPEATEDLTASSVTGLGKERGALFYLASLRYGQCLWRRSLPAQALLQLNRAFAAKLEPTEAILVEWPLPYRALAHFLSHAPADAFLGNPRRHFQHYATRMAGPQAELRTWRAWACWALTRRILPDLPADEDQIANEGIREPRLEEIGLHLTTLGHPGEWELWLEVLLELN